MTARTYDRRYEGYQIPGGALVFRANGAPDLIPGGVTPPGSQVRARMTRLSVRGLGVPPTAPDRTGLAYTWQNAAQFPTATSDFVGPLPGTSLVRYPATSEGDYVVGTSGPVSSDASTLDQDYVVGAADLVSGQYIVQNKYIRGELKIGSLTNVKIRNCIIRGTLRRTVATATITASGDNFRGAIIEDCLLYGRNVWVEGMRGGGYTIQRCEIQNTTDGIGLTHRTGNVNILGNYIHNLYYEEWAASPPIPYPPHPNFYVHSDGVQFHAGKDYVIRGNYVGGVRAQGVDGKGYQHHTGHVADIIAADDCYNSCHMIKQEAISGGVLNPLDKIERVMIEQNVYEGSLASINATGDSFNPWESLTFRDNKFVRNTLSVPGPNGQIYILKMAANLGTFTNNTFLDTGATVPISAG